MRSVIALSVLLSLAFCGTAQASSALLSKVPPPKKPLSLTVEDTPDLSVVFRHDSHKGVSCALCHHKPRCVICHYGPDLQQSPYASCSMAGCHPDEGRSKDGMSRFMSFHKRDSERSCFGCHVKEGKVDGCRPCHDAKASR